MNIPFLNKSSKNTKITLKEYGSMCKNPEGIAFGYQYLSESVFDRLEQFILENKVRKGDAEPSEFMVLSSRRGIGKVISAKNHVGVFAMKDGTQIEILPKLYTQGRESSEIDTKKMLIHMLRSIKDIPNKNFRLTSLQAEKNHVLDIFIRMFIEEVSLLVKRGLKSDYREHCDNDFFYKGKLQVAQHIKRNAGHKERFYVEYDSYSINRPENRLIKTTIELLMKITGSMGNQKELYTLLAAFDNVETTKHLVQDWACISTDRMMKDYLTILDWCRLFLSGQSFTPFKGDSYAYALLFPMEKVYEQYVVRMLRRALASPLVQIKAQDRTYRLFNNPARFQLQPDIVVQGPTGIVVLDTKWKRLTIAPDYGISQADMYQAYAYGKKYGASQVYLLYPWTPEVSEIEQAIRYESGDGMEVRIAFLDLSLGQACLNDLSTALMHTVLGHN
ncbi:McrC family protein [Paenibacillus polymyxa]|uniref:McrC family protein n=1 Tax=Paenibacillus polymyxa TaxID=1406 RepID=UPI002AB538E5|nr:McrC family protein [Paenibacillus polymyxa]MDY8046990.1 McrC family protein [Paenibacillus polymyxa]